MIVATDQPSWYDCVVQQLRDNRKVCAIKEYRAATGQGLKESKAMVDGIQFELGIRTTI